jgi:hypothetical protein
MKKILLLTAILVVAFTVNAFATLDEGTPTTETGTATVVIPGVFHLDKTGTLNISFSPDESNIAADNTPDPASAGTVFVTSNYNNTNLVVGRSAWSPNTGEFTLKTTSWDGNNGDYDLTIPDSGTVTFKSGGWSNGTPTVSRSVEYRLRGLDFTDDPGTYTSTVTFTLSHS